MFMCVSGRRGGGCVYVCVVRAVCLSGSVNNCLIIPWTPAISSIALSMVSFPWSFHTQTLTGQRQRVKWKGAICSLYIYTFSPPLSLSVSLLHFSLKLPISLSLPLSVSLVVSPSLSHHTSLIQSVFLTLFLFLYLPHSASHSLYLPSVFLSPFLSISLYTSSFSLSLSLSSSCMDNAAVAV